jgi:hypothetical protein
MNANRIPGNEPDVNDMAVDPSGGPAPELPNTDAAEDEATKLGDFA